MNIQLNCPYCQQLISADSSLAGNQIQCPTCHQLFMIAANVAPVVPVVQARVAPPPAQPRQKPSSAAPQPSRKPAGTAPRPPQTAASKLAAAEKEEAKVKLAMAAVVLGGVALIVGGISLVSFLTDKSSRDITALPAEVVKRDQVAKAQRERDKREAEAQRAKEKAELRAALRDSVCKGNDLVAGELVKEMEAIESEYEALFRDPDPGNDPKNLRTFWTERITQHAQNNGIIRNWLGGRSAQLIVTAFLGPELERKPGFANWFLLQYSFTGTAFCISPDGWMITNQHVTGDAAQVDVRGADGRIIAARVVKTDAKADLSLLKISEKPAAWLKADTAKLQRGDRVFTVGFPNVLIQGVEPKFTDGKVSSTAGFQDEGTAYQISVPVDHGNSGGALVNLENGVVAGVINAKLGTSGNISYAIKGEALGNLLKSAPETAGLIDSAGSPPTGGEREMIDQATKATYLVLVK